MNMRAPNLIHGLTFDISFAGAATDSLEMADWIKGALLPVMEEVFDQHDRKGQLRRIEQLEIDLGTVSQDESQLELARRLFAQLSEALGWSLESATASSLVEEREQQLGAQLLDFLRTGQLAWSVATDARAAHQQLLQKVLESAQAEEILRAAVSDPQMLTRLLRQFDAVALRSVAALLYRSRQEQERAAAQPETEMDGVETEAYWRRLLQSSVQPPATRNHREELVQLRCKWSDMGPAQRDMLRKVWAGLGEELRRRVGSRTTASLNPEARSDLAMLLRPRAQELFETLGADWALAQVEAVLQLLLAGDDATAAVDTMLLTAETIDQADAARASALPSDSARRSLQLVMQAWLAFNPAQREAFRNIWLRLSGEVGSRTGGRGVALLSTTQKAELAIVLRSADAAMLKEFGEDWPESMSLQEGKAYVWSMVDLLLEGGDAVTAVASMLSSESDRQPAVQAKRQLPALSGQASVAADGAMANYATWLDRQMSAALVARMWRTYDPAQRDAFKAIWQRLSGELASHAGGRAVATLSSMQKAELAMLLQPRAADALRKVGQARLELASVQDETVFVQSIIQVLLDDGYATAAVSSMLSGTSTAPANTVDANVVAAVNVDSDADTSAVDAADTYVVEAASAAPAEAVSTVRVADVASDGAVDVTEVGGGRQSHAILKDQQASLALLQRIWRTFDPAQRDAFRNIWQHLSDEVASRVGGQAVAALSAVQEADLSLTLLSVAEALLNQPHHQWPASLSSQDKIDLAQSAVRLLLAHNEATPTAASMLAGAVEQKSTALTVVEPGTQPTAPHHRGVVLEHDALAETNVQTSAEDSDEIEVEVADGALRKYARSHSQQLSQALLTRMWSAFDSAQRHAFRDIWRRLSGELTIRAVGREISTLSAAQKTDLASVLQPVGAAMLHELRLQWPQSISAQDGIDLARATLELLLDGGEVSGEVALMLAGAGDQHPVTQAVEKFGMSAATLQHRGVVQETARSYEAEARAKTEAEATEGTVRNHATLPYLQMSMALLTRLWSRFDSRQRVAFRIIWQRLAGEVASRIGGRAVTTLNDADKVDLVVILRPVAEALLKTLQLQWPESVSPRGEIDLAQSTLQLVLAGDDVAGMVASMFAETGDKNRTTPTVAQREANLSTPDLAFEERTTITRGQDANADDGMPRNQIPSRGTQESMALMTRVWLALGPAQRDAFRDVWLRLSAEAVDRTGVYAAATLGGMKKTGLTLTLQDRAMAMLKELRLQWPESVSSQDVAALAKSAAQLLLAGGGAKATAESLLANTNDRHPPVQVEGGRIDIATAPQPDLTAPAMTSASLESDVAGEAITGRLESQDQQADVALLKRWLEAVDQVQRDAFRDIWRHLADEVVNRIGKREMDALSTVQKVDLSLTLRPITGTMLKKLRHQWPELISLQDEKAIAQSTVQLLLLENDATAAVASMLASASDARTVAWTGIDPSLAAFRDWQQGKLDILSQPLSLADLRQWLNWWLLHDPQRVSQDCSLMLSAIDAQAQDVADSVLFMKLVLANLQSGDTLDLETLALQSGRPDANDEAPVESTESISLPDSMLKTALQSRAGLRHFIAQQDAMLSGLNSAQLHQIVRSWVRIEQQDGGASLFLSAIETHALQAGSVHEFLRQVLLQLISDQPVDLEQLLAETGIGTDTETHALPPADGEYDPDEHGFDHAAEPQAVSALPAQLKQALPQRLANAMLQGDLASLEIIWPEIIRSHASELAEAAKRYLSRSDLRARLIARADIGMLKDLLGAVSKSVMRLAEPILQHGLQCGAMLAPPLAAAEFEQRVLRFAFEQALKPDVAPIEWLHALMASLQEMTSEQRNELQHAWYEVLLAGKRPALLLRELDRELFVPSAGSRNAPEQVASLLLMREAELDSAERTGLASLLQRACSQTAGVRQGALESALSDPQSIDRLTDILPSPKLARVFAVLQPGLALELPALLRHLHEALAIPLAPVPAMLDRRVWRAIYLAAFADGAIETLAGFTSALVIRLAGQYRQADPGDWLEKLAGATFDASAAPATGEIVTPDQAMARLLQPWAEPKAEPPARRPAPAKRGEDEPQPFTGESNIHNAGMVIVVPYIQRLFGLLELTVDGKFVSEDAAQRGVHLLQYVVTGEEATPEYQLVLNKLLCGIRGGVPIVPGISITDKEKTIIEQMLNGVITHWSALGTTSIDGLRETFLQRQGHLYFQDEAWQLKIPQKTFDMLLDRLPWSFALTKMPWMTQPLHVTWR
jgi:hypothetical protein